MHAPKCGKCPLKSYYLPNRTATTWKFLPCQVVNAVMVNSFKDRLNPHLASFIQNEHLKECIMIRADTAQPYKLYYNVSQLSLLLLLLLYLYKITEFISIVKKNQTTPSLSYFTLNINGINLPKFAVNRYNHY